MSVSVVHVKTDLSRITTAELLLEVARRRNEQFLDALKLGEQFVAALSVLAPEESGHPAGIRDRARKLADQVAEDLLGMKALEERR